LAVDADILSKPSVV